MVHRDHTVSTSPPDPRRRMTASLDVIPLAISETTLRQQCTVGTSVVLLFALTFASFARYSRPADTPDGRTNEQDAAALHGVDPNTSTWYELAQIPGIGPALANRVVAYREQVRREHREAPLVFRQAADLLSVHGLGPKKVARLGRLLRFPQEGNRR